MDSSVIGLVGIVVGVVLTSIFQLVNKYIDYRLINKNRWIDDKKQTYADFLMASNTWFRVSLIEAQKIAVTSTVKRSLSDKIAESRSEMNSKLAMISVIAKPEVATEAEGFNEWMQVSINGVSRQTISAEDAKELAVIFSAKRASLTAKFRKDLS